MNANITKPRPWTLADKALLRREYNTRPAAEVALLLGRTVRSVKSKAGALGLFRPRLKRTADVIAACRALHRKGLSDRAVAQALGVHRAQAMRLRRSLGLKATHAYQRPFNSRAEAVAEARRRDARARAQGYRNWGDMMHARRRMCFLRQHPFCTTASQVAVCRALQAGPLSWSGILLKAPCCRSSCWEALRSLVRCKAVRREGGLYRLRDGVRRGEED